MQSYNCIVGPPHPGHFVLQVHCSREGCCISTFFPLSPLRFALLFCSEHNVWDDTWCAVPTALYRLQPTFSTGMFLKHWSKVELSKQQQKNTKKTAKKVCPFPFSVFPKQKTPILFLPCFCASGIYTKRVGVLGYCFIFFMWCVPGYGILHIFTHLHNSSQLFTNFHKFSQHNFGHIFVKNCEEL